MAGRCFALLIVVGLIASAVHAAEPAPPVAGPQLIPAAGGAAPLPPPVAARPDLLTAVVLKLLPDEYVDDDDWGGTSTRWDGLKVDIDGLRLKTKRRKKEVNHGDWERYTIRLVDAGQRFRVRSENLHQAEDGRLSMDIVIDAPLHLHARHAKWVKGVQLYSVEALATADVRLSLTVLVGLRVGGTRFAPEAALLPEVTDSKVELTHFELHRVSDLRGEVAERLGRRLHQVLVDQLAEKRDKLTAKINRQVEKNHHHLRFSVPELLDSQFGELLNNNESAERSRR